MVKVKVRVKLWYQKLWTFGQCWPKIRKWSRPWDVDGSTIQRGATSNGLVASPDKMSRIIPVISQCSQVDQENHHGNFNQITRNNQKSAKIKRNSHNSRSKSSFRCFRCFTHATWLFQSFSSGGPSASTETSGGSRKGCSTAPERNRKKASNP